MMKKTLLATSLLSSALILPSMSFAEDVTWDGNAELGFIQTSGNSDTQSLNSKFKVSREEGPFKSGLRLVALTSEESGERSKEKYLAALKFDYAIGDKDYLTSQALYEDDRFNGYQYQSTTSVGYGYHAWEDENGKLDLEAGPGYRRDALEDRNEDGDKVIEEAVARLSLDLLVNLGESAKFTEAFTVEAGDSKTVYTSDMGLQSTLTGSLAMKISYEVKHTTDVPEGTKNTDSLVGITLVYDF
ncbi:MAG: putative salt-induced outer membrane protein YdiY [Oleispira sp.]|jgi:putative salt-induced outer membrane protein YdiY|tara:strand:- start:4831 stop:5562 length:732 start_codon:yes stop_codon:yes gene_type:complete